MECKTSQNDDEADGKIVESVLVRHLDCHASTGADSSLANLELRPGSRVRACPVAAEGKVLAWSESASDSVNRSCSGPTRPLPALETLELLENARRNLT